MVEKGLKDSANAEFQFCNDPAEALQVADRFMPTVIVQSLSIGDFVGFDLVKSFRQHPSTKDVPVIILSGKEDVALKANRP